MITYTLHDEFEGAQLAEHWQPWAVGGGLVAVESGRLRLALPGAEAGVYADAQITDYAGLPRSAFPWRPPLRMTVRAVASGPGSGLYGTAGFGLWNDPFMPGRAALPRVPRAAWFFFAGPRNDMRLALDQPSHGWKAATFDAARPLFWALLPLAPLGFMAMRQGGLYRRLWPVGQRAIGVAEAALPGELLAEMHTYTLDWYADRVVFAVDGEAVLATPRSPRGPLGFIAWIDNQYAVVTPQGRLGWGMVPGGAQWLALDAVTITPILPDADEQE